MGPLPSQVPSQILDHQLATIALEKFSFAVTTLGTGSHQWVHDTRADKLLLVFRQTRQPQGEDTADNPLLMSVIVGSQILERQDLRKLTAMVEDFEIQKQKRLVDRAHEPPVHIMVKFPCIALRYPTSLTLLRRIQMRFKNEVDYQSVVGILETLKLPVNYTRNSNSPAAPNKNLRPASTSQIQNPAHSYVRDQRSISDAATNYEIRALNTVNDACYTLPRPLLTEESPFFRRSHTASSDTTRPNSALSLDSSRASDTVSSMSFSEPLVRPSSVLDDVRRISASQSERTQTHPSLLRISELEKGRMSQLNVSQHQDRNQTFTRNRAMSEAFSPPLPKYAATSSNGPFSGSRDEFGLLRRATSGYENPMVERLDADKQMNERVSLVPEFLRPLSAPVPSTPESFSQWLPPKRELPFPKTRASTKSCLPTSDLPPSSELQFRTGERQIIENTGCVAPDNTTRVFPRTVKRVAQRQTNRAPLVTQRNMSDSPAEDSPNVVGSDGRLQAHAEREEEPSPLAAKTAAISRPSTAPGLQSKVMTTATRKRGREAGSNTVPVNKQARVMVDKATQTQTGSGRDHTAPLTLIAGTGRPLSSTTEEAIQPPKSFMNEIECFISRHKHRPPPEELWQRPGYSEASPEERQAIINDFICENLDNENFLKLCEDTGNVWRRIGLEI